MPNSREASGSDGRPGGVGEYLMPPDELARGAKAAALLGDLLAFRCSVCGLYLVCTHGMSLVLTTRHQGCAGTWWRIEHPLARELVMRFLSRQMFGARPQRQN